MSNQLEAIAEAIALDQSVSDAEINFAISRLEQSIEAIQRYRSPGFFRAVRVKQALEYAIRIRRTPAGDDNRRIRNSSAAPRNVSS